ncbi:MAG: hypothetical protein JJ693_08825 [Acidithiobacillus sp.]|nr:hypothetical protein [Acidithiobacillus sp.]
MHPTIHRWITFFWIFWTFWVAASGFNVWVSTSGTVYGSNYGMLITLAHMGGMILIWLLGLTLYLISKPQA